MIGKHEYNVTDQQGRAYFVRASDEMDARIKAALQNGLDATKLHATRVQPKPVEPPAPYTNSSEEFGSQEHSVVMDAILGRGNY